MMRNAYFLFKFALFFLELEDRCYIHSQNFKIQDIFVGPIHFKTCEVEIDWKYFPLKPAKSNNAPKKSRRVPNINSETI